MTYNVQIDDVCTRLEVECESGDLYRFRLGDQAERHAELREVEPGVYSVLLNGRSYEAHAEAGVDCAWISLRGHRFRVTIADPRRWSRNRTGAHGPEREDIIAPMPGKIVRVLVEPGQAVESEQGVIVMEAMKMQNEMRTRRAGRVAAIQARIGETVRAGAILATIE
jgi:biotin carboxyl carrier protein